jgi:hypothetical protein
LVSINLCVSFRVIQKLCRRARYLSAAGLLLAAHQVNAEGKNDGYNSSADQLFQHVVLEKSEVLHQHNVTDQAGCYTNYSSSNKPKSATGSNKLCDKTGYASQDNEYDQRFVCCEPIYDKMGKVK